MYLSSKSKVMYFKQQDYLTCLSNALNSVRKYDKGLSMSASQLIRWGIFVGCIQYRSKFDTRFSLVPLEVFEFSKEKVTRKITFPFGKHQS